MEGLFAAAAVAVGRAQARDWAFAADADVASVFLLLRNTYVRGDDEPLRWRFSDADEDEILAAVQHWRPDEFARPYALTRTDLDGQRWAAVALAEASHGRLLAVIFARDDAGGSADAWRYHDVTWVVEDGTDGWTQAHPEVPGDPAAGGSGRGNGDVAVDTDAYWSAYNPREIEDDDEVSVDDTAARDAELAASASAAQAVQSLEQSRFGVADEEAQSTLETVRTAVMLAVGAGLAAGLDPAAMAGMLRGLADML